MANPWYSTGTITVTNNSKEVSAVGALWVVNNVGAGDILFAPDGLAYEVETLSNDNLMTLKTVYKGASASSQPYGLVRFMSQSPISLANLIVDKTVRWEDVIDQLATYISGDATTSSVAPEDLCINYSLGTVKTGIAQVDCPVGFTFVASGANVDAGWFLFQDTVGNYRVSKHPETFRAEITALKDASAASEAAAAQSAIDAAASLNKMGEVNFKIAQAIRKEIYDRSGFVEFGSAVNYANKVNKGLWLWESAPYLIEFGRVPGIDSDDSSESFPIVNINGRTQNIRGTFLLHGMDIKLPPAPVITHADATNSGLVLNGTFDTDTVWTKGTGWAISGGVASSDGVVSPSSLSESVGFPFEAGVTYITEMDVTHTSGNLQVVQGGSVQVGGGNINTSGRVFVEFTAVDSSSLSLISYNWVGSVSNIAIYPKHEVERTDLVFLESWEEDTAEKGYLYPYGNIQYLGGDTDGLTGIINGDFVGFGTYSLFGNWQASGALIGKGYKISNLTFAQLAAFVSNPENNCYYTDTGELIQVRYRIRTVEGFGDEWSLIDPTLNQAFGVSDASGWVQVKGKEVSISNDIYKTPSNIYVTTSHSFTETLSYSDDGIYYASAGNELLTTRAYQGRCYAMPIALVKRLNQGAYHPLYNNRGCSYTGRTTIDAGAYTWYDSNVVNLGNINSTIDTFNFRTANTGYQGAIGSLAVAARPDLKLYDAIYADQIVDLRLSAYKNWTAENTLNHLVNGGARGLEGDYHLDELPVAPYLRYTDADYSGTVVSHTNGMNSGEMLHCDIIGDPAFYPKTTIDYTTTGATQSVSVVKGNKVFVEVLGSATGTVGNYYVAKVDQASIDLNLQDFTNTSNWIDTGSTNSNSWQENLSQGYSLFGTPLLVGENGEDYIPDGTSKTFKASRKVLNVYLALISTNGGTSWAVDTNSWKADLESASNSRTVSLNQNAITIIFYKTYPETVEPTLNSSITDGEIGSVIATSNLESSAIVQSLINKVPVGSETTNFVSLSHHQDINANLVDISYSSIDLAASDVAVSMCAYKTEDGIEVVAKELKHDGVDWGDNSKITQADNVTTDTDLNAATVLVTTSKPKLKSDLR